MCVKLQNGIIVNEQFWIRQRQKSEPTPFPNKVQITILIKKEYRLLTLIIQ